MSPAWQSRHTRSLVRRHSNIPDIYRLRAPLTDSIATRVPERSVRQRVANEPEMEVSERWAATLRGRKTKRGAREKANHCATRKGKRRRDGKGTVRRRNSVRLTMNALMVAAVPGFEDWCSADATAPLLYQLWPHSHLDPSPMLMSPPRESLSFPLSPSRCRERLRQVWFLLPDELDADPPIRRTAGPEPCGAFALRATADIGPFGKWTRR